MMAKQDKSKSILIILVVFLVAIPISAFAASVNLRWKANTEPDISSYNVYFGTSSRNYGSPIPTGNVTSYVIDGLVEGRKYYFAITAVDTSGNESGFSSEVSANATSTEPASEPYKIVLSTNSDRSNPVPLQNKTITGDVFVFIQPENAISQVVFNIDGKYNNTERYAPYDLGVPFDTTRLSNGSHTISAEITLIDNSRQTVRATFNVSNSGGQTDDSLIPLPSSAGYGMIKQGDQTHVGQVKYSFSGMSGDVTLSYQVWDVDNREEVTISLNGTSIAYAGVTANEQWSGTRSLRLPGNLVNNTGQNTVIFNNTGNPPNKWWWGVRSVSVVSSGTAPLDGGIPLPSSAGYGMIRQGDQTHVGQVRYNFSGMSGDVTLSYQVWDVDNREEVTISLNGTSIAFAGVTANDQWSGTRSLRLPDSLVNNTGQNTIVFNNTGNPPNKWWWGVRSVSIR